MQLVDRLLPQVRPAEQQLAGCSPLRSTCSPSASPLAGRRRRRACSAAGLLPRVPARRRVRRPRGPVVGALWWDRNRGSEQIPELVERAGEAARPVPADHA